MPEIAQTRLNRVYPAERWGDTMVVRPKGDAAGFSVTAVNTEMATIKSIMESGDIKHLVVDLSGSNYFGSVVLGALVQLGTAVRNRGGRIALTGASRDMQDILRLMKLDQMWELHPDTRSALRRMSRIPLKEKFWAQRFLFFWFVACIAVAGLYFLIPSFPKGRQEYLQMSKLWREVESRRKNAGIEEWARLEKECSSELAPIVKRFERLSRERGLKDAEPSLLYAARDYWLPSMQRSSTSQSEELNRQLTQYYLRCAEAILAGRPRPARVVAAQSALPADEGISDTVVPLSGDSVENPPSGNP